jgi:hypothetical protein
MMSAQVKLYAEDDNVLGRLIRIAYDRFRAREGLQDSQESAVRFAGHWTDDGAAAFLGRSRDEIVEMLGAQLLF